MCLVIIYPFFTKVLSTLVSWRGWPLYLSVIIPEALHCMESIQRASSIGWQRSGGLDDIRSWEEYMFIHPDGRRWIGYKVGTYIVDEAIKRSEKSVIELTQMECTDIIDAAGEQS